MVEPQTTLREQVIHVLKQDNLIPTQPLLPSQSFDFTTPHLPPTYHSSAHLHPVPPPQAPIRDISILAGERFCFKGVLKHEDEMKAAVLANGGAVTGGGFKHTTYGVVGGKWKPTRSWETNGIVMLSEDGFWELLYRKTEEARVRKESIRLKGVGT
jgi:NAD-dependent DNA ligase